jgi:N-acetylmuramoyl-L-alanine amidase
MRDERGRGVPDRGVKQGPWWVLLGALARMPSVIVEVGFVSNVDEERYLASAEGQRRVARAIAAAIAGYRQDVIDRFGQGGEEP